MRKVVFLSLIGKGHKIHRAWAESLNVEIYSLISNKLYFVIRDSTFLRIIFSMFSSFFIPKADIYLLDSIPCSFFLFFKLKKSKIILINSDQFFFDLHMSRLMSSDL